MYFLSTCPILFFIIFYVNSALSKDTLISSYGPAIFSSILFRHGDRTYKRTYPNDPYRSSVWREGEAQLTKIGKLHEFQLGQFFRERYDYLVKDRPYRYDFLTMKSSDVDRTLMSAELFLAGFYPPSSNELWNVKDKLLWQPIPVHTVPKNMDNIISQSLPCEKYRMELDMVYHAPESIAFYEEYKEIFKYVSQHSGMSMPKKNLKKSFKRMMIVEDALLVEDENNLPLPSWTKKVFPQPLTTMSAFFFSLHTFTQEMKRLKAGPLLKSIIDEMTQKITNPSNFTFSFYSGHDTTIVALLNTLGVFNNLVPPYSASVIFELREKNGLHYVTLSYKNSSREPHLLEIAQCKNPCLLIDFIEATKSLVPVDIEVECNVDAVTKLHYFSPLGIILVVIAILALFIALICTGKKFFRRKKFHKSYLIIPDNSWNSA